MRDAARAALLLLYLGLLVLAAWVPEVRPGFLDGPQALAARALAVAGVRPGIAVFVDPSGADAKWRAHCLLARGVAPGGERFPLFPPGGACTVSGFRFRLPPVELGLHNMMMQAREHHLAWTDDPRRRGDRARRDAVLANLGRYFCDAADVRGAPVSRVELVWYGWLESYSTGARTHGPALTFGWDCTAGDAFHAVWLPDETTLLRFWGGAPWE